MSDEKPNSILLQHQRDLENRMLTRKKKQDLEKFRDKQEEGTVDRKLADELLGECDRLGDAEISRVYHEQVEERSRARASASSGGRRRSQKGRGKKRERARGSTGGRMARGRVESPPAQTNTDAGEPSHLGQPFHNPYTFIPFPPADWFSGHRERRLPTPLTIDELEVDRFTGILELELETLSPLMTCHPTGEGEDGEHKTYRALVSGDDVIVPATGVRGSLRALMTVLAGGTLSYIDDSAWLVQSRDLPLGPARKTSDSLPLKVFLARVIEPGAVERAGTLELGRGPVKFYKSGDLENLCRRIGFSALPRPKNGEEIRHLWVNDKVNSMSRHEDAEHRWQVKLSGLPVGTKSKSEGLFLGSGKRVTVPAELWKAYLGRNRHGDRRELQPGDLVWLEAISKDANEIGSADDIASIQWARWGRRGERLLDIISQRHEHMIPDNLDERGLVDEVTDLFGQAPADGLGGPAGPFAARVRPENLVFFDAKHRVSQHVLAPLAPPHPGCAAFYRDQSDPDRVTNDGLPLRGYKVYRNTAERGTSAPWLFTSQGVYGERGKLKSKQQKVNKTCELLAEGCRGTLRIACRGLSDRELALLLLACSVDWRLGGGKPLGLGHCRPIRVVAIDEQGEPTLEMRRESLEPAEIPEPYAEKVEDLLHRRELWHISQIPVPHLRYPRAVRENRNCKQRGGHIWFQRHANPKKSPRSDRAPIGLQVMWVAGDLEKEVGKNRIRAQVLPPLSPTDPQGDVLYGYDAFVGDGPEWVENEKNKQTFHKKVEPFDLRKHARDGDKSSGTKGQSRQTRKQQRKGDRS